MTRDDIIRMAREAGLSNDFGHLGYPYLPELERFASLVAAAERSACAQVCEFMRPSKPEFDERYYAGCTDSAAAIRARREQ